MNLHGTIQLIAPTGKAVDTKAYCSSKDSQSIIDKWYLLYSDMAGFLDFQFSVYPRLDHEASKQLGIKYPQLKREPY